MTEDKEPFLARWSRLKRRTAAEPAAPQPAAPADAPAPQLPRAEDLTFESDFKDFMHRKVEEGVRRVALRKLFHDPHFNVRDGLDVYAEDYTKLEKLPTEMAERLLRTMRRAEADEPAPGAAPAEAPQAEAPESEARRSEARESEAPQAAVQADPAGVAARPPAERDAEGGGGQAG